MSQRVLVPIKSCNQIDDLMPCLEDFARPGMTIVFLVHFGANRFAQLAGRLLEIQSGLPANLSSDGGAQQSHFKHRTESSSQALRVRGVRIEVKFYSGRLQPILRQCIEDGHHHTVMMRPGATQPRRLIEIVLAILRKGGSSRALPVLQCYPSNNSRRSL